MFETGIVGLLNVYILNIYFKTHLRFQFKREWRLYHPMRSDLVVYYASPIRIGPA